LAVLVKQFLVRHDDDAQHGVVRINLCEVSHVLPQNVIEPEPVNLYSRNPPETVTVGDPVVEAAGYASK
jgi:hypothetical protein